MFDSGEIIFRIFFGMCSFYGRINIRILNIKLLSENPTKLLSQSLDYLMCKIVGTANLSLMVKIIFLELAVTLPKSIFKP